jgi:hypothetical protein
MKKFFAFVLTMAFASVASANAGLVRFDYTEGGTDLGITGGKGMVGITFTIEGTDLDYSGFSATDAGKPMPPGTQYEGVWGTKVTYLAAPSVNAERPGWFSIATAVVAAPDSYGEVPGADYTIFSGVSLTAEDIAAGYYFSSSPENAVATVNLNVANGTYMTDAYLVDGSFDGKVVLDAGIMDTVYVVPEPMTMSLLGLGGLVAARRRRA